MIRVLIADDHQLVRQGFRVLLENAADIEVVGEARDGREAVERTAQLVPDVVLMDVDMPHLDGVQATRIIRSSNLPAQVIMVTMLSDSDMETVALANGAKGYILKNADRDELTRAIRKAYQAGSFRPDKGQAGAGAAP